MKGKAKGPTRPPPTLYSNPKLKSNSKAATSSEHHRPTPFFPLAQYTSLVGVHTTLLLFVALFLPRTPVLFSLTEPHVDPTRQTSRDRPQHPFFEPLTRNPAVTVASWCVGALVLQLWWGGWVHEWWVGYRMALEGKVGEAEIAARKMTTKALGNALLTTFVFSLTLYPVAVLFGAPLTSHVPQTYVFSLLLSILAVFPPALTLGAPKPLSSQSQDVVVRMTWTRLFAEFSIRNPLERAFVYPAVGTFVGCWIGAVPIALDWDRPWQAWPLTPAFGAITGYVLASLLALTVSATQYFAQEGMKMKPKQN